MTLLIYDKRITPNTHRRRPTHNYISVVKEVTQSLPNELLVLFLKSLLTKIMIEGVESFNSYSEEAIGITVNVNRRSLKILPIRHCILIAIDFES